MFQNVSSFKRYHQGLKLYIISDITSLILGYCCAWLIATIVNNTIFDRITPNIIAEEQQLTRYLVIASGVIFWLANNHHYRIRMSYWLEVRSIVSTLFIAMLLAGFLQFSAKEDFSRIWLVSSWIFAALFIILFRSLLRIILKHFNQWYVPTLLVGQGITAQRTLNALKAEEGIGYKVVAQIDYLPKAFADAHMSWAELCQQNHADYVMIALDSHHLDESEDAISKLIRSGLPFSVSPPRGNLPVQDMIPQYFFNHDVKLLTHNSGLEQALHCYIKRSFDVITSLLLIVMLSPIMLVIALLIRAKGGPALYAHQRLGRDGKIFNCLKFRSMDINSEQLLETYLQQHPEARQEWEDTRKLKNDPRITPIGLFIRKTSLDELPQLFNVLIGDMSLVGPRPIVEKEIEYYASDIEYYYRVRPGITGLWQVSGRNDVSYSERVHLDSWYVRNWSLWHDVAILFKTIPSLLNRSGAY